MAVLTFITHLSTFIFFFMGYGKIFCSDLHQLSTFIGTVDKEYNIISIFINIHVLIFKEKYIVKILVASYYKIA